MSWQLTFPKLININMETCEVIKRIEKAMVEVAKAVVKFDKIVDAVTPLMDNGLSEERIQFIKELNATERL